MSKFEKTYGIVALILITAIIAICLTGCTEQDMAKEWGGTYTMDLPKGEKLMEVTWKDTDLWYLTRPMRDDEEPETYTFREDSEFGIWEGTVIIVESK